MEGLLLKEDICFFIVEMGCQPTVGGQVLTTPQSVINMINMFIVDHVVDHAF